MRRMATFSGWWWVLVLVLGLGPLHAARAVYLDEDQKISLRLRAYTQGTFRLQNSEGDTTPSTKTGQLIQNRNFFNPELEAKLVSYTSWMKGAGLEAVAPDALDFRLAGWGFYDGIYDYGTGQFQTQLGRTQALFFQASNPNKILDGTASRENPREFFGNQQRVNELYLSYSKGPVFLRVGKQAISWGESDTIALLDQNNPFDLTLAAPGLFEDVDEARIPLWTVRASYSLFDSLGPLSSGLVEAYWVPGDIDTTVALTGGVTYSPYSAPQKDPQSNPLLKILQNPNIAIIEETPASKMSNSRYGVRLQTVVARDYTVSAWFYTAFNQAPVPVLFSKTYPALGTPNCQPIPDPANPSRTICRPLLGTELVHRLVPVVGISNTFFFQPMNGIIRMEAEYFNREPAFIPNLNLLIPAIDKNPNLVNCPTGGNSLRRCTTFQQAGYVPFADFLRWELGYDRFFFLRPLNPTNSFVWVTALVGSYNMDETSEKDFRFDGQQKPGTSSSPQPQPDDFVQLQKVEIFGQSHIQTDYLHGRLTPGLTVIAFVRGTYAVNPTISYRWSDSLLFDLNFVQIGGMFQSLGFFRDRAQVALRATYQLN